MTTTAKAATKILISEMERSEVMKKACLLSNVQINDKIDVLLTKIMTGTATEKERREATILAQVYGNRLPKKR